MAQALGWISGSAGNISPARWLAHAALALVLFGPAAQAPRPAVHEATGIRPRDAVEVAFAARTHPATLEQAPRVRRVPPRAGTAPPCPASAAFRRARARRRRRSSHPLSPPFRARPRAPRGAAPSPRTIRAAPAGPPTSPTRRPSPVPSPEAARHDGGTAAID